ncbi:MAG: sulfite exporter TauE/SafE family protein [Candidatus Binatia bacterium]
MTPAESTLVFALIGLASNVHCAAMCGPLLLGGCRAPGSPGLPETLAYHAGRLTSYVFVGTLVATAGEKLLAGSGQLVSLVAAETLALLFLLQAVRVLRPGLLGRDRKPILPLLAPLLRFLPSRGLGLGLITAFLPCGSSYAAYAVAAANADPLGAGLGMAVFAVLSAPGLVLPILLGRALRGSARAWLQPRALATWAAVALLGLSVWTAARPFNAHSHGETVRASGGADHPTAHVIYQRAKPDAAH